MKSPWQRLSSREIYKNDWIRLREDKVITPGGAPGIYGVVEAHPALAIVPLSDDMHTYLVGQYRYTLDVYSWEVPEGGGLPDETPLQGAKRELMEETGLAAEKWTFLDTLYTSNSFTNEIGYVFLAEGLKYKTARPDHTEELQLRKLPFKDAWQMTLDGEIKDALAVIALMRVHYFLQKQGRFNL